MMDLKRSIVIEIDAKGAVVGARKVEDALKGIERNGKGALGKIDKEAKSASRSMDMMGTAAKAALAYLSVSTVANFAKAVLDAGVAMDSLQRSFVAISGSQYGAAETIAFLRSESDRLGQSFYALAPGFKNISAAARDTSLEGEGVRKVFSAVTEAATALGMSTADTEGTLRALAQMISKGTVQAEELRGQLGERLPGAFQLMAKALGVTTPELNKMLEQGQVLANDALPKLAAEITRMYGAAAETTALESGQAAINKLSQSWMDFKVNLYDSDGAVAGINAVTEAIIWLTEYANLRSISETFAQGAKLASDGKLDFEAFKRASYLDRQRMVDNGGALNKMRGSVNRGDVRTAPAPVVDAFSPVQSAASKNASEKAAKAAQKAYEKMISDGQGAAKKLETYWTDYEDARVSAITEGVEARAEAEAKNLELITEFADKYKEIVLGETDFKLAQIAAQAEAYRTAGADEIAVAKWVEAEKQKVSRDWQDGAVRALEAYADASTNAAALAEQAFTNGFQSMEDALVDFVMTGKASFSDLADSIISDLARIVIQQQITGPLASGAGDFLSGLFSGGSAVGPKVGYAKGGIPGAPSLHAYANSIVSSPTVFPFARGVGLMGEAGPEAIIPLKRGPDGVLGVRADGGGMVVNIIESPGNGGKTQQRQENGVNILDVMVEQIKSSIASDINRGSGVVPQAITKSYGLSRAPGAY